MHSSELVWLRLTAPANEFRIGLGLDKQVCVDLFGDHLVLSSLNGALAYVLNSFYFAY